MSTTTGQTVDIADRVRAIAAAHLPTGPAAAVSGHQR